MYFESLGKLALRRQAIAGQQPSGTDVVATLGAGSLIAELNPEPAENLPLTAQGAGFADYAIFTGIDPFALDRSDVLLFNFSMDLLSSGSEEIFLSGEFNGDDVPEPSTGLLLRRRR